MTSDDSIFSRLFELFQSPGPVNWRLADEVRKSLVGAAEPVGPRTSPMSTPSWEPPPRCGWSR